MRGCPAETIEFWAFSAICREMLKCSLLLGNTESLTGSAGGLGLLTSDLPAQVVTETSVLLGLLHALEILTESGVDHVGDQLGVGAVLDAALSVEEPRWDAVLLWAGDNIGNLFNIFFGQLTSALVEVDLGNLEGKDGKTSAETLDDSQGEWGFLLSVKVGVLHTQDVDEVIWVLDYEARLNLQSRVSCVLTRAGRVLTILSCMCS